jgi:curved DNA-binding protein CbpA
VKVVAYFDNGNFLYAAANVRALRLREYLQKSNLVSAQDLAQFNEQVSDRDMIKVLAAQKLLSATAAEQIQTRQVSDVLCMALLWTEGTWEFDSRSRLNEQLNLKIDANALLLETGRRMPKQFAASRFPDPAELIAPLDGAMVHENLTPAEGFLLSRLDRPMTVRDLIDVTGVGEAETLHIVYSLALAGLVKRDNWKSAFNDQQPSTPKIVVEETPAPAREQPRDNEIDLNEVESFLQRMKNAQTHYDVLSVATDVSTQDVKTVYYQLARRYHPDRFRKAAPSLVPRLESAFARITQAYDTLQDDALRASYNSKLAARKKVEKLADSAPKAQKSRESPESTTPTPQTDAAAEDVPQPVGSVAERAETQFKEGFAALELGHLKVATGLFASAASAVPNEPRYRAFYGHLLASNESTRRAAEAHLHAAIKLDPANSEYRVMLAELYQDLGLKLRAKGEAERAIAADPNNRKARDLLRALK